MFVQGLRWCLPAEGLSESCIEAWATASKASEVQHATSVPLRKYWRKGPLVFSFVPRCQGLLESSKNTDMPVSTLNCAWADISLPWSQVSESAK